MARTVLEDIQTEGTIDASAMRAVKGGAGGPAAKVAKAATPFKAAPQKAPAPPARNARAHVHANDGIHDNNNRIGNNGIGPKKPAALVGGKKATPVFAAKKATPGVAARRVMPVVAAKKATPGVAARRVMPVVAAKKATPGVAARRVMPVVAAKKATPGVAARRVVPVVAAKKVTPGVAARRVVPVVAAKKVTAGVAAKPVVAVTGATGSKTNRGALTNDPSANNPNAHNHQTDGIHDDNNRIGNNGLGPVNKKSRTNWNATLTLAAEKNKALPADQKVGSSGVFYEKAGSFKTTYAGGKISVDVVKSMTLTAGEDSNVRDAFTFTRANGAKGYGIEYDTRIQYGQSDANSRLSRGVNTGNTTWSDESGNALWRQWGDPLALDLDGDNHVSLTGVGSAGATTTKNRTATGGEAMQRGVVIDFNNDGKRNEAISFATGRDAMLAVDRDGDGIVTKGSELFGPTTNDGMKELTAFDSNKDGLINKLDVDFSKLKLVRVETVSNKWGTAAWGKTFSDKNYQMTAVEFDKKGGMPTDFGYVQKMWSLDSEGISEINLTTLAKARPAYDAKNGFSSVFSTTEEAAMRNSVLSDAQKYTGSASLVGATLEGRLDKGGASAPTAQIAQIYKDGQAGFGAAMGSLGNDPNKNKVPSARV